MSQMKKHLNISDEAKPEQLLEDVSLEGIIKYIKSGKCKKIVTMAGAGISTCKCFYLLFWGEGGVGEGRERET